MVPKIPVSSRSQSVQQHSSPNFPPKPADSQKLNSMKQSKSKDKTKILDQRPTTQMIGERDAIVD